MEKITAPRGTKDVLPEEVYKWHALEKTLHEVAARFGFRELRFPTFEDIDLFCRGVGDTTDVVQKEMYDFIDKGGRHIALRPEGTASVVRAFIEHSVANRGLPQKFYYIAPNFRYEKPQAGRLREHHQFGVECFGSAEPSADAEVISLAYLMLEALGIKGVELEINSCGCADCRKEYHAALKEYFSNKKSELCETCLGRLERNPMRILDCKSEICKAISADAPKITDYLCDSCATHFSRVKKYLDNYKIAFTVNPRIVRGLDYYTNTVFEFTTDCIGAQATVCGGGRYNTLVGSLGGPETPGLGFGCGLERLLMVREAQGIEFPNTEITDIFIATIGQAAEEFATRLCFEMRRAGVSAETDLNCRSLKAQMRYADKIGARYSMVIGEDEIKSGKITLKRMSDGEKLESELNALALSKII